jgi:hypothetical protein
VRIALTRIRECQQRGCSAPIFAELLTAEAPGLCFGCAPAFVERREKLRGLFFRSGGRLPSDPARAAGAPDARIA